MAHPERWLPRQLLSDEHRRFPTRLVVSPPLKNWSLCSRCSATRMEEVSGPIFIWLPRRRAFEILKWRRRILRDPGNENCPRHRGSDNSSSISCHPPTCNSGLARGKFHLTAGHRSRAGSPVRSRNGDAPIFRLRSRCVRASRRTNPVFTVSIAMS